MRYIDVPDQVESMALLDFLPKAYPQVRHGLWLTGLKHKDIRINGKVASATSVVHANDEIRIAIADEILFAIPRLKTLYEDEKIRIIEKPPGYAVLEADTPRGRTIEYVLKYWALRQNKPFWEIPVHRLDTHTGGTLILAKTRRVAEDAIAWFDEKYLVREYRAVVVGCMPKMLETTHYATKDSAQARVHVFDTPVPGSVDMRLCAYNLMEADGLSLVTVQLLTGRTHQIRAQLAHMGHPVLGDEKYGIWATNARFRVRKPVLWHNSIGFLDMPRGYKHLNGVVAKSPPQFPVHIDQIFTCL